MSLFKSFFLQAPEPVQSEVPLITLLYEKLPRIALAPLLPRLGYAEPLPGPPVLMIERDWCTDELLLASIQFGEHIVELAGIPQPLPAAVLERTLSAAHWAKEIQQVMRGHGANCLLRYAGTATSAIEQYLALYKVAYLLNTPQTLGIVNEPAWTAHPAAILERIIHPDMMEVCRNSPPLIFWTGFLKLDAGGQLWYLSRGHHLFGLPDFAKVGTTADAMAVQELFTELFTYWYFEKPDLQAGDVLALEANNYLELLDGEELRDEFGGMAEILILRPAAAEDLAELDMPV